ncbi:hypothetical protein [Corynebacterium lubricantis]|uniref:hypothetical protein n=1 Tax=Corynebacterium lubricantis TaxID=541095 RepID=UPI000366BD58|nr:hypothetical protein [Corynebacterium lubricantis]
MKKLLGRLLGYEQEIHKLNQIHQLDHHLLEIMKSVTSEQIDTANAVSKILKEAHAELNFHSHNGVKSPQSKVKQAVDLLGGWGPIFK